MKFIRSNGESLDPELAAERFIEPESKGKIMSEAKLSLAKSNGQITSGV